MANEIRAEVSRSAERSRIVVTEQISHHEPGNPTPTVVGTPFSRFLQTDEQPFQRRVTVGEEWMPLDLGWIGDKCGMLHLFNETRRWQVNPSREELDHAAGQVVEVAFNAGDRVEDGPDLLVLPGESCRLHPAKKMFIRCRSGKTKLIVTAFPS